MTFLFFNTFSTIILYKKLIFSVLQCRVAEWISLPSSLAKKFLQKQTGKIHNVVKFVCD
jgi:hypothetical protein